MSTNSLFFFCSSVRMKNKENDLKALDYLKTFYSFEEYLKYDNLVNNQDWYPYQHRRAGLIDSQSKVLLTGPRQCGTSRLLQAYALWYATTHPDSNVALIDNSSRYSGDDIRLRTHHNRAKIIKNYKYEIGFNNGSTIFIRAPLSCWGASLKTNLIIVDIYGKYSNDVECLIMNSPKSVVFGWPDIPGGVFDLTKRTHVIDSVKVEETSYWSTNWETNMISILGPERFQHEYRPDIKA